MYIATKRSENPALATDARRTNSILILRFVLGSFSMVLARFWLGFKVGIIPTFQGVGKVCFFSLFEDFFEAPEMAICQCLVGF